MLESRDSAIKLFGKEISLHHDPPASSPPPDHQQQHDKDTRSAKTTQIKEKEEASQSLEESTEQDTSSMIIDDQNPAPVDIKPPPPIDIESTTTDAQKPEEEQSEMSVSKEKTSKKPDKILPCPRCNSMDTKFCYYNNYNVNQPRHFCKNCQRYWTAGGTMRNVPVGAGRRKNKNSSHYRHITMSEALQTAQTDMTEALHHNTLKPNGTVLSFGADAPLCESMASVLKIAEKTVKNCQRNGFHHRTEEKAIPVSFGGCDNGEEHSSGSSVTATNSADEGNQANLQEPAPQNCPPLPPHIPCFVGAPWNCPWNSPAQWSTPIAPPPAFCASSFPVSFYTAPAYWGCTVPGAWTFPWVSPPSSSPTAGSSGSGPNSLTLGKHSRDGNMLKETDTEKEETLRQNSSEKSLWFPKTLRIDDPDEAAKSSIWTTLGIKNGKTDTLSGRGFFKDFKSKADVKNQMAETSPALHANPAALSRSLSFRERS